MLLKHQIFIRDELKGGKRFVVAACRTGKTRPVIDALRGVEGVLVLTKKAAISGWLSELEELGVSGWVVENHEKARSKWWDESREWGALVIDEIHSLAGYPKPNLCVMPIFKAKVIGPRVGVTATPCAESYSQLFHQAKALKLPIWEGYRNFYAWFKDYGMPDKIRAHGREIETYKKIKPKAWEEFAEHCVIVDRAEVMPDFVESEDNLVRLEAPEVLMMCEKLKREGVIYIGGRAIVADSPMALAQKAQQICAGVVLDDEGVAVQVNTIKRDWVLEQVKRAKIAVLTQFKAEVDHLVASWEGFGSVGEFRAGLARGFVGNVQKFARGVDLSVAESLILTGCPWSAEAFIQSRDRLLRQDRTRKAQVYFPVIAGGIDEMIYNRVAKDKMDFHAKVYT